MGDKSALLIGNGTYDHYVPLGKSIADVRALRQVLWNPYIGAFEHTQMLIDQPVEVIREAIRSFFSHRKLDDTLLLYLTGHGVLSDQYNWFFACKETPAGDKPPEKQLDLTAVSAHFIRECIDKCDAERQIIVLDTCSSGAFTSKDAFASKGPFESERVMKLLEGPRGSGRAVLAATSKGKKAAVGDDYFPTSIFTYYLVQGLITGTADSEQEGKVTVDHWFDYALNHVPKECISQQPSIEVNNRQGPIVVAHNPLFVSNPDDAYEQHNKAYTLYALGQNGEETSKTFEKALKAYEKRLRLAPQDGTALLNKGNVLFHIHCYQDALRVYEVAVKLRPDDAVAWHNLGCTLYQLQRRQDALVAYKKALNLDRNEAEIWYNLGHALNDLRRYSEAYTAFDEASKLNPTDPKIWMNRALVCSQLGLIKEEEVARRNAQTHSIPGELFAFGKGVILERLLWNKEVEHVLRTAAKLAPADAGGWLLKVRQLEEILQTLGNSQEELMLQEEKRGQIRLALEEAVKACERERRYAPGNAIVWHHLGSALAQLGMYEESINAYRKALELAPIDRATEDEDEYSSSYGFTARVWYEMGFTFLQLGMNEEALSASQKALRLTHPDLILTTHGKEYVPTNTANVWIDKAQRRRDGSIRLGDSVITFHGSTPRDFVAAVLMNIACAYCNLGVYREALKAIEESCRLAPDNALAQQCRGKILLGGCS